MFLDQEKLDTSGMTSRRRARGMTGLLVTYRPSVERETAGQGWDMIISLKCRQVLSRVSTSP